MQPGTLGALAGFAGALVSLGVPLVTFLYRIDKRSRRLDKLLVGHEEMDGDGVIPRLRDVEQRSVEHRMALRDSELEIPDLSESEVSPRAD